DVNLGVEMESSWLVIGLGNPGEKYVGTRHNAGHLTIDHLAQSQGEQLRRHKTGCQVASLHLGIPGSPGPTVHLAKLDSYMNTSGIPTAKLVNFFGIDPTQNLLVVHDELDLVAYDLRLKRGGGEGGHNGLRSISQNLGTKDYARLRIGIGRPHPRQDPADYVLSRFPRGEQGSLNEALERAGQAITEVVTQGFVRAQQRVNSHAI
ncbi:aminoacyl-tRNA hydrolase, partial [Varibaculum cambriense]